MTEAPRSPVVAFGLHAASKAMAAKQRALTWEEVVELDERRERWLPGHAEVAAAVEAFLCVVCPIAEAGDADRAAAADAFLARLVELAAELANAPEHAGRIAAALEQIEFEWQRRADLA